ncbi:uncharacterized protein [Physcomitrium patens]|uniref:uncharacterized protein n=1 Tax=Physcomitrium patens TaxID=3218 RepID=UPI000D160450|nr:uncharacterized protein LOC112283588 [Physcomitrium patens]|eukprot:XP_024378250.1 uncharacterized protein LOC112283588 [Physcomitrella patens]
MIFLGKEGVPSRCPGDASAIQGSMSARDCHGLIHALPSQEKQRRQPTGGFRSVASGLRGKLQLQTRQRGLHDNPCMSDAARIRHRAKRLISAYDYGPWFFRFFCFRRSRAIASFSSRNAS